MRMHVVVGLALGACAASACGEQLAFDEDVPDAGADAADPADAARDADVAPGDAGGDACVGLPCGVQEVTTVVPNAIAASATAFVWFEQGTVKTPDPDGGAPLTVGSVSGTPTGFLALEGTTVFFTQSSGPRRCVVGAPCDSPGAPIFGFGDTGPIAVGAGDLFAADRAGKRPLGHCASGSTCGEGYALVALLPARAARAALTTTHLILAFEDQTIRAYARSTREPLDAGTDAGFAPVPAALVSGADVRGLAGAGADFYWTDGAAGTLSRCTPGGCTSAPLLSGRAFPRAVAAHSGKLYWVETNADAVLRCTAPTCADPTVVARVGEPVDLAVGDRVYVVSNADQKIYAAPR